MQRAKHSTSPAYSRVSVNEIAVELGIAPAQVRRLLAKHGWWIGDGRRITARRNVTRTYHKDVIEKLRGLLGQEHRQLDDPESDWLSRYMGGT